MKVVQVLISHKFFIILNIGGGHYFVYIFDNERSIWRRYNDIMVEVVSEEEVMRDAFGNL